MSKKDSIQIAIRVPKEWLTLADKLAKKHSKPGAELTRTDALRMAMAKGLGLEQER